MKDIEIFDKSQDMSIEQLKILSQRVQKNSKIIMLPAIFEYQNKYIKVISVNNNIAIHQNYKNELIELPLHELKYIQSVGLYNP